MKKLIGRISSSRLFYFLLPAAVLLAFPEYFIRELWFDEVLTLQFAMQGSVASIYRSYFIPNNQLIHTFFIHWLLDIGIIPEAARLFPFLCGAGTIWLLWKNFSREFGKLPLIISLTALVISPPFLLYAGALRGYMLAAFFTVGALCCGKRFALGGKKRFLAGWFIFSLLSVGVMPSALAGLAGAGLFLLPYCGRKFWKNPRLYLLAAAPFAALVLFYAPIYRDLFNAFALKEGWHHAGYALLAVGIAGIVTFFIPLTAAVCFHRPVLRNIPRMLIWFLPLGGVLLPVSPFPRVWFVLFPLWALLTAGYLRKVPEKYWRILGIATVVWGLFTTLEFTRELLSPAVSLGGQDDFYAPYFMKKDFLPSETAGFINTNFPENHPVFVSFGADPPALWYFRHTAVLDIPPGRCTGLPSGTVLVLGIREDTELFETRFQTRLYEIRRNKLHKICLVTGEGI